MARLEAEPTFPDTQAQLWTQCLLGQPPHPELRVHVEKPHIPNGFRRENKTPPDFIGHLNASMLPEDLNVLTR